MRLSIATLMFLGWMAGAVQAATVTYTTTTPIPAATTDWSSSLAFQQFNPSLGTLSSVTLKFTGVMNTVVTATNNSQSDSSGTAKTEIQITVQDNGGNLLAPTIDLFSPLLSYVLAPGQSTTSGQLIKTGNSSSLYSSADILAEFTGPGSIILPASTFSQTSLTNTGGNTYASQTSTASLTGQVIYEYAVPEPATLSLLALGGLALRRRR